MKSKSPSLPNSDFWPLHYLMPLTFHHRPALVAYLTCGDPDLATTQEIVLAAIEAGAEVIELGCPSAIRWRTVR